MSSSDIFQVHRITYILFRFFTQAFRLIPFALLPAKAFSFYIVLAYVIRYRSSVIDKNLQHCFPGMSVKDRKKLKHDFYKSLADITAESFKVYGSNVSGLSERFKIENPELLDDLTQSNGKALLLASHLGNWEWGSQALCLQLKAETFAFTKPLSNTLLNGFIAQKRAQVGMKILESQTGLKQFLSSTSSAFLIFINDQYPAGFNRVEKVSFFGKSTAFNAAPAYIAKKFNLKTYTIFPERTDRSKYKIVLRELNQWTDEAELIQEYATALEEQILRQKESWLWSHKRFKDSINY